MITFKYFLEGENPSLEFFKKRMEGADKIAIAAKEKGGPSMLTYYHFAAKAKPYTEVLEAIQNKEKESFYLDKCDNLLKSLKIGKIDQKKFQEIMGMIEVYGEALTQLFV